MPLAIDSSLDELIAADRKSAALSKGGLKGQRKGRGTSAQQAQGRQRGAARGPRGGKGDKSESQTSESHTRTMRSNRKILQDGNDTVVRLYDTDVVRIGDGVITLDSGGFMKRMTMDCMNEALEPFGFTVKANGDAWQVSDGKMLLRFSDGMKVPLNTTSKGKGGGKGKGKGDFGKGGKGGGEDTLGNVPCGTVIDTDITDRHSFNFYLVSQHGLKGTARPTHYHVLDCPPTISADEMQQFTFDLCHVYARCTKIASRPAPLYYAHLAASHAPWYEKEGFKEVSDSWEVGSTSSGGSRGSAKSKSNYEPLNAKQASRLYYC